MKFERIRLTNFKCYADADLELDDGVTVIHGLNGSGKSSLLEACFFALYGAKALDQNLDDIVTLGEEEAKIDLWFTHDGGSYHLHRRVRATGKRAQTAECVLEAPGGSIDGARDVREHVAGLFRMDSEAFVNCAYVRQGEVNKLINASPSQRQDMIDDLLQLGKLEEYRERASDARLGVKSVLDDKRGRLAQLDDQIETKEDKDLHGALNDLESKRADVDDDIERFEGQKENAEETLANARDVLESHEEKREELDRLDEEIADLQAEITEREQTREHHRERIGELRERAAEQESEIDALLAETELSEATEQAVERRLEALDADDERLAADVNEKKMNAQAFENQATNLAEKADDLETQAETKREEAADLEAQAETAADELADRRDQLDALDDRIEAERAKFEDAPVSFGDADARLADLREEREELRTEESDVRADLKSAKSRVEEAEKLLDAGKCPECGQPVDGSPHVDSVEADRERVAELESELADVRDQCEALDADIERAETLADAESEVEQLRTNRENIEQLVADKAEAVAERRERAEELTVEADELENEAAERRTVATEKRERADALREDIADLEAERDALAERRERLEQVRTLRETMDDAESDIEALREKRTHLAEMNDQSRERLSDKRERRNDLRDAYDEDRVEQARNDETRAEDYLEKVEQKLSELRSRRDELQDQIGGVKHEIEELERLRENRDELAERVAAVESLRDEAADLESMYGELRADLRQRNVESLERMLNEVFDLVYQNDSYARIELDAEYELTVYQKDGEPLDPQQLSGGERALFNLSLRCAIYRLLAEGIEGAAPMPPLILDEPTVFLDSGHVSQLVELVESMRELGVEQIIVVSHDDELVGAADDVVSVVKDSTTNRSSVQRRSELLETAG